MPKKLFDEDDGEDLKLKTNNEYAKNYNTWRKKEEFHKLKAKYGEDAADLDSDLSGSSEDDEVGAELTQEIEKKFYKTLSCLKQKDPRIYDENVRFFEENDVEKPKKKEKKEKPVFIKDYERKLLLEKGGHVSDSDIEENDIPRSPTYIEEQQQLKENLKKALDVVDAEDEEWGGMFKARQKTEAEKQKEEEDYKKWLAGQKEELEDKDIEEDLKPLKDYWNDPKLNEGEKFLRDYILNKRYLDEEDADYVPTYDEIVHDSDEGLSEDENQILKQEEFEVKYNYRFEEPDHEFIKRYPRTMENSVRIKDDKRQMKRAEIKERKRKEKEEKMKELKKLQELKKKEIEEKIQKLKEITGNTDVAFEEDDIEGDFDPEAHDKRMQSLFNDEFYAGPEGEQKPEFPDLDEELELERWDKWDGEKNGNQEGETESATYDGPHCEDEDFNMDCDYDPKIIQKELIENSKGKKKRRRKSKFAKMISEPKPIFDPNDKTYEEYLEEYYKFDCEDIIGDIPCRFKYRKVPANSFGLTVEEILLAKDRELNRWCSLKKAVQYRPEHVEKYDQITYERKGNNLELKKKILPSLFESEEEKDEAVMKRDSGEDNVKKEKKKKKRKPENGGDVKNVETDGIEKMENVEKQRKEVATDENASKKKKKKKKHFDEGLSNENKKIQASVTELDNNVAVNGSNSKGKYMKNKKRRNSAIEGSFRKRPKMEKKKENSDVGLTDARLSAYGFNAKKFRNKLKYKNKK